MIGDRGCIIHPDCFGKTRIRMRDRFVIEKEEIRVYIG